MTQPRDLSQLLVSLDASWKAYKLNKFNNIERIRTDWVKHKHIFVKMDKKEDEDEDDLMFRAKQIFVKMDKKEEEDDLREDEWI